MRLILCFVVGVGLGQKDFGTYDYVVVGAGAAGGVLAVELASRGFRTLLMEAGPDYTSSNVTTPALHLRACEDPNIAWDFLVKHYSDDPRLRLYPRASGLGGCTLHNAMIHLLPHSRDFDQMVRVTGDESWSRKAMLRNFGYATRGYATRPGAVGKLKSAVLGMPSVVPSMARSWLKLTRLNIVNLLARDKKLLDIVLYILGLPIINELTGYDANSFAANNKLGVDQEKNFLVPINADPQNGFKRTGVLELIQSKRQDPNLTILTDSLATQILLDSNNTAYGVKFLRGRHLYRASKARPSPLQMSGVVYATREVIVSAGTFNTPQLMMLSGIGDSHHLEEMDIPLKVHLPGVGRNLHDRYEISVNLRFKEAFKVLEQCTFVGDRSDPCFQLFQDSQSGPYAFSGVLSALARKSNPLLVDPDLIILIAPIYFAGYRHGMADDVVSNKDVLSFLILKAHSFNRAGAVRLSSNDPRFPPDINFNYFETHANDDIGPIIAAINEIRRFAKSFTDSPVEVLPGKAHATHQQLDSYIRNSSWGHHATGTMKIGVPTDPMAVLDGQFRVRGTNRLRVVDMSIFPDIPGYFPTLYLYLVAQKAAQDLVRDVNEADIPASPPPKSTNLLNSLYRYKPNQLFSSTDQKQPEN